MKRECKNCIHMWRDDNDGINWCQKHRNVICQDTVVKSILIGCDDFWPKDRNPRCDECRFYVGITANSPVGARHGECHVKGEEHSKDWFCENWRARG